MKSNDRDDEVGKPTERVFSDSEHWRDVVDKLPPRSWETCCPSVDPRKGLAALPPTPLENLLKGFRLCSIDFQLIHSQNDRNVFHKWLQINGLCSSRVRFSTLLPTPMMQDYELI
jgi:hypothetical protein